MVSRALAPVGVFVLLVGAVPDAWQAGDRSAATSSIPVGSLEFDLRSQAPNPFGPFRKAHGCAAVCRRAPSWGSRETRVTSRVATQARPAVDCRADARSAFSRAGGSWRRRSP